MPANEDRLNNIAGPVSTPILKNLSHVDETGSSSCYGTLFCDAATPKPEPCLQLFWNPGADHVFAISPPRFRAQLATSRHRQRV